MAQGEATPNVAGVQDSAPIADPVVAGEGGTGGVGAAAATGGGAGGVGAAAEDGAGAEGLAGKDDGGAAPPAPPIASGQAEAAGVGPSVVVVKAVVAESVADRSLAAADRVLDLLEKVSGPRNKVRSASRKRDRARQNEDKADEAKAEDELRVAEKKLHKAAQNVSNAVNRVPDALHPLSVDAFEAASEKLQAARGKIRAAKDDVQALAGNVRRLETAVEVAKREIETVKGQVADARAAVTVAESQDPEGPGVTTQLHTAETELETALQTARAQLRSAEDELGLAHVRIRDPLDRLREAVGQYFDVGKRIPDTLFDSSPIAFTEIKNLIDLDDYPVYKKALDEWYRRDKDLRLRVSRRETRSGDVTNQIFNIIGWYAVFLGVVLTAVSQLTQTSPGCKKVWFPVLLTVYGTLVTVGGVFYKFTILKELEVTIQSEKQISEELQRRVTTLQRIGPQKFSFRFDADDSLRKKVPKSFWIDKSFVFVALLVLTALFIVSYFVILCNTGASG